MAGRLRRILPWGIAGVILWFLFRDIPLADALRAAQQARLDVFLPATLVAVTAWFLIESVAFSYLFSRFNAPLTWREARSLRAVTYLLTPINWNLGTAAIILHLRRSKSVPALEITSSLLYYGMIDGLVLGGLVLVGALALAPSAALGTLVRVASIAVAFQACLLAFFLVSGSSWGWVRRVKALRIFHAHSRASWLDTGVLFLLRSVYFAGFVLYFWIGTRAFDVQVPILYMAAAVPVILMVAAIPITPAGLGTQQATMLYFFRDFGSDAQILAYGLAFPVALILGRLPLGLLYLRDLRALRRQADAKASDPPEPLADA